MRIKRPRFDVVSGKPAAFSSAKYTFDILPRLKAGDSNSENHATHD